MASSAAPPLLVTTEDDWSFLEEWVSVLHGCFQPHIPSTYSQDSDVVRVGLDPTNDFWLEVSLDREDVLQSHDDGEQAGLRQLREAIVLVHLLATANYDLWYKWIVQSTSLTLPACFIAENAKVKMQYVFKFSTEHDLEFLGWDNSLAFLLGDAGYSDDFLRDLHVARELLERHGIPWGTVAPIPIMLDGFFDKTADANFKLERVTRAVKEIEQVEQQGAEASGGIGVGAVFKVVALEIDLGRVTMNSQVFDALYQFLRLGLPMECVRLPQLPSVSETEALIATMERIGEFTRTLLGLAANQHQQMTQVRRIVMPLPYARTRWFVPFCSALATTRTLRVLHLYRYGSAALNVSGFGTDEAMRRHIWSWLAFALFSSASTTSVEALLLIGEALQPADVDAIQAVMESPDPLAMLCEFTHDAGGDSATQRHGPRTGRSVVPIPLNTVQMVTDGMHRQTFLGLRRVSVQGELLHEGDDDSSDCVFVPGLGFCHANHEERPTKRPRIEDYFPGDSPLPTTASAFKTLRIRVDHPVEHSITALVGLCRLIGSRLRGLAIDVRGVNETTLQEIFEACPHLESFALRGTRLRTLDVFKRAYETQNLPLSSLHLSAISISESALQRFLRSLLQSNKVAATLQRLRFGYDWAHELSKATLAILGHILDHNKTLTHLVYHITHEHRVGMANNGESTLEKYHGHVVDGLSYVERYRQMAFLGGVRRLGRANKSLELDTNVKKLVLQFAAAPGFHRSVVRGFTSIGSPDSYVAE